MEQPTTRPKDDLFDFFDPFDLDDGKNHPKSVTKIEANKENKTPQLVFNPFEITPEKSPHKPIVDETPATQTVQRTRSKPRSHALPPKLGVKLVVHEEVTSLVRGAHHDLYVEGKIYAQVMCSDANKNAPFELMAPVTNKEANFHFQPDTKYDVQDAEPKLGRLAQVLLPKSEISTVPIGSYTLQERSKYIPVLVERKVTSNGTSCRVAVQVRSRLTNLSDMVDICIVVAVPERVIGETIKMSRGDGSWDGIKRIIKWKVSQFPKGESLLVSAEAQMWTPLPEDAEVHFPVLFRCSSLEDPMVELDWKVSSVEESPAAITSTTRNSFRLLHRLT